MRQSRTIEMLAPCGMFLQFPQAQQNDAPISAQVLVIPGNYLHCTNVLRNRLLLWFRIRICQFTIHESDVCSAGQERLSSPLEGPSMFRNFASLDTN
jgi:hypothetical protein